MSKTVLKSWLPPTWQAAFLMLSSSWLAAPFLNDVLSKRVTSISQFEAPREPYSWIFLLTNLLAGLLLLGAVAYLLKQTEPPLSRLASSLLWVIGLMLLIDPILAIVHVPLLQTGESILAVLVTAALSIYDARTRRKLPSTLFVGWQLAFFLFYLSNYASGHHLWTLTQASYLLVRTVWLTWLTVNYSPKLTPSHLSRTRTVRWLFAVWAYLNGLLAIVLGLVHIHLIGVLKNFYFAGNTAWLAQHGVVVGVAMIYLSRHLSRGEHRARLLFLLLLFIETIKYAIITPDLDLLALYGLTFSLLFVLRAYFPRGSVAPSWHERFQEAALVLSGAVATAVVVAFMVSRNHRLYVVTHLALQHFAGVETYFHHLPSHLVLRSSLLEHTLTTFLWTTLAFLLWSLFRPAKVSLRRSGAERAAARQLLERYAVSSEDFFKLWPHDKYYYWSADRQAFIAYTIVDAQVFALADPVAPTAQAKKTLLESFVQHWHDRGYTTCFLMVAEPSLALYQAVGLGTFQIGSSAIINIQQFVAEVANDKWWRWQKNRSLKAGYSYHRAQPPHSDELMRQCRAVSNAWLERPGHRERGFALGIFTEAYLQQCTLHYLTDDNHQVIAFTNQVPVFNNLNQATVDMMRYLPDKNNAMPFLLANVITSLAEEEQHKYFDLGFVPLAKMDSLLAALAKTLASRQVSASGLEQFKGKFKPTWQKNYLVYDGDLADLATLTLRVEEAMRPE